MQNVIGPYEVLGQLGSGGMGVVYRARDTRLQREVAIKVLSDGFLGPDTPGHATHQRFLREARSASSLNHPNICTVYDVGEQDGKPYLVMELLQGRVLKEALRESALPLPEVIEFSIQIARGLEEAHEAGIIHRDIKPANIFIVRKQQGTQQAKILDFGLAKQSKPVSVSDATSDSPVDDNSLTMPGSTVGTVAYMSPEQARGEPLDARSDLFSLGSVIYEMMTGKLPFPGSATADVFAALLTREPDPIRRLNPAVSRESERIIQKLHAKDKTQRYQTATSLRIDLEQLSARSGAARSATLPIGMHPSTGRGFSSLPTAAGALALLLALGTGGYFFWHGRNEADKPGSGSSTSSSTATVAKPTVNKPLLLRKEPIILSNFTNTTGDPVFDTMLNQGLAVRLGKLPSLNLVSEEHVRQSLKRLGKPSEGKITPKLAREIGVREGVKAIVNGSIAKLDKQYIVTLEAQATGTGESIALEQAQAPDKDHVLTALDQATTALSARLGESLSSIQSPVPPAPQPPNQALGSVAVPASGRASAATWPAPYSRLRPWQASPPRVGPVRVIPGHIPPAQAPHR